MYNLLIALAVGLGVGIVAVLMGFPWYAGVLPGLLAAVTVGALLFYRTYKGVEAALRPLQDRLAAQDLEGARALLREVDAGYSNWQPLLRGQLRGQLGMLSYIERKFDEASPLLDEGSGRDWTVQTARACLRFRRKEHDAAWEVFQACHDALPKEATPYAIHAILRNRAGDRSGALAVLSKGLESLPDHPVLRPLKTSVANKQKVDPVQLGEVWFQFFPEEVAKYATMGGRRGGLPFEVPQGARPVMQGRPQPRMRGKLARKR